MLLWYRMINFVNSIAKEMTDRSLLLTFVSSGVGSWSALTVREATLPPSRVTPDSITPTILLAGTVAGFADVLSMVPVICKPRSSVKSLFTGNSSDLRIKQFAAQEPSSGPHP